MAEITRRGLGSTVGQFGERIAREFFDATRLLPKLVSAPNGTQNVDALSRTGDRYSIKTVCSAKKTGTIYPDRANADRQLFEYLLVIQLTETWELIAITQFTWVQFLEVRAWDRRMSAWYVPITRRALSVGRALSGTKPKPPKSSVRP